jgi:hypothetical protein
MGTQQELIAEYKGLALTCARTDYGDKPSVKAANVAADRMRAIAFEIAASGPVAVAAFGDLVRAPDVTIANWAAHHILEHMSPEPEIVRAALDIIERTASGTGPDAFGDRIWLQRWKNKHQSP